MSASQTIKVIRPGEVTAARCQAWLAIKLLSILNISHHSPAGWPAMESSAAPSSSITEPLTTATPKLRLRVPAPHELALCASVRDNVSLSHFWF